MVGRPAHVKHYDHSDWYWRCETNPLEVYSTAREAFVPVNDPDYQDWLDMGNQPGYTYHRTHLKTALDQWRGYKPPDGPLQHAPAPPPPGNVVANPED